MNKEIEQIYKAVENKAKAFTREELQGLIVADGFDKNKAKEVIKELDKNKVSFKGDKPQVKTEDKEKILKELSKSVKSDESKTTQESKPKEKKQIKNPLTSIMNFFKKIYFFFEDGYYSIIDSVSKVIPVNKVTDQIDKIFPSFILFLILIISIIYFIFFFGVLTGIGGNSIIDVTVTDTTNSLLSGATVILSINDENTTQTTDSFGNTIFEDIKFSKKDSIKLIASKESYNTEIKTIEPKKNIIETIVLDIDTTSQLFLSQEQTREILFKENETLLATRLLQVKLSCSNSGKTPSPSTSNVVQGKLTVNQPTGCGFLRIDVTSDYYNLVQNQVVPENNTIMLSLKTIANVGKIEAFVNNLQGGQVTGAIVSVYKMDDLTTPINESNLVYVTGTTDYYGRFVFENLAPGTYTLSTSKDGYISSQRTEGKQVLINNTTAVNLLLLSPSDLQNLDCRNPIFSPFCKNGCLDCNNSLLTNYYTRDTNGNLLKTGSCCQIGRLGYINVNLVDANGDTTRVVKGDITIYKKNTDSNGYQSIETREDVNSANFFVLTGNYKIAVTNTEDYGYFPATPVDVNGVDRNISIPLEYSSVLNTGIIGVKVKKENYNYAGASVYLYDEDDTEIPINSPKTTNSSGDVNFPMVRANRDYFAFAVASGYQGQSNTEELDANDFLELSVNLESQAKILNLNVNVRDYNISFYSTTDQLITDYSINTISDTNKDYIFRCPQNEMYAVISAENKSTYQTDLISLVPGQKIYYKVILGNQQNNAVANIEFLGIYDESGINKLNNINIAEHRNRTLKLKYKFTTTTKDNRDLAYAFIRAGKSITLSSDYLRLETVFAPGATFTRGCNYHGSLVDWNESYFTANYEPDHSQTNCANQTGFKWAKINFSDSEADQIEFSVNFKFQNELTQLDNYVIYYRALTKSDNENYVFSPTLNNSWQNCNIRPQGYFYAPTSFYQIPFTNSNYNLIQNIYDWNNSQGSLLLKNGENYELKINHNYLSNQKFIYLSTTHNINNEDINAYSVNTLNALLYKSYSYKSQDENQSATGINATTYKINSLSAEFGTEFDHNSVFGVNNFFNTNAKISTNILDIQEINPRNENVLSYYDDSNVFIEILTNDLDNSNNIYIGDNIVSFRVRDKFGNPIPDILIKYQMSLFPEVELGETNENGYLLDRNISLTESRLGDNITFRFTFPVSYVFPDNQVVINKNIKSGYKLVHTTGTTIDVNHPLIYNVGKYTVNGVTNYTTDDKNYYVVKSSAYNSQLDVTLGGRQGFISITDMNTYLHENNILPTTISDANKLIKTQIKTVLIPQNATTVVGTYINTLNIGIFDNQPIIFTLDADIKINKVFDVNLNTNTIGITKPGKGMLNNEIFVELIKNVSPIVDFNYTITNNSANPITIGATSFIDPTVSGLSIDIIPAQVNIASGQTTNFQIKYQLQGNVDATSNYKSAAILFGITANNSGFIMPLDTKIRIYSPSEIYSIKKNPNLSPPWVQGMSCSYDSCSQALYTILKNETKTYDFNLYSVEFNDLDNNFTLITQLPQNINSNSNKNITLDINGNYDGLDNSQINIPYIIFSKPKMLKYSFNINNLNSSNVDINVPLTLNLTIIKQTIQELLEEQGLYGNICLGFGSSGPITNNNFDIIGLCELEAYDSCKSGEEIKPKIKYTWGDTQVDWTEECIDTIEENYDTNKTHCDSLQMLFSVFKLINNDLSNLQENNTYIYLMNDGVSEDLLKDLISYNEFLDGSNFTDFNDENPIMTIDNIEDGNFSISKTEKINTINVPTNKPGKYRIKINNDFETVYNSPLHIDLELVREMPYSMRNLLYYIPIDGKLGIDTVAKESHRDGYGSTIINDANLPIVLPGVYLYKNADGNNSIVKIIVNNNDYVDTINQEGLRNTLNSEGKLIDIRLDTMENNQIYLTLNYSPSFPIPIFARVVNSNTVGLNYRLKEDNSNNYNFKLPSLLKWEDYNYSSKILRDNTYNTGAGLYSKSQVNSSTFRQAYGNNNNIKLLKTTLYWPMSEKNKMSNIYFTLIDEDLSNHDLTKIYTLSNIDQNGSKNSGRFNQISRITIQQDSLSKIFNLVYNPNSSACMESGLTSVIVRWIDDKVGFTETQKDVIVVNSQVDSNIDTPITDETTNQETGDED